MSHTTHFDDCGCLTARYEARIATLEAERDTALHDRRLALASRDGARDASAEWQAHASVLRDALEKCDCETLTNGMGEYEGHDPKCVRCAALLATPAASLAALKAEVLERAAVACETMTKDIVCPEECAAVIRALRGAGRYALGS